MARLGKTLKTPVDDSPCAHDPNTPPHALSCLAYKIGSFRRSLEVRDIPWPSEIPLDPLGAARWWVEQQQPAHRDERPQLVNCAQQDGGQRWQTPYLNRLVDTLQTYIQLPDDEREMILAARADNVWWRGDEVKSADGGPGLFLRIYDETLKAREYGSARQYIEETKLFDRMRQTISKMTRGKSRAVDNQTDRG